MKNIEMIYVKPDQGTNGPMSEFYLGAEGAPIESSLLYVD